MGRDVVPPEEKLGIMVSSRVRRPSALLLAVVILVGVVTSIDVSGPRRAGAETLQADLTVNVQANTATTGLNDGDTVSITATATTGSLYQVDARLCKASANFDYSADFNPTGTGNCMLNPVGAMTSAVSTNPLAPPYTSKTFSFKVGVGTDTYTRTNSQTATVACGPAAPPCKIVVKLSTSDGANPIQFVSFPISYASQALPPDAPTAVYVTSPVPSAGRADVHWTAPTNTGGVALSSFTATAYAAGVSTGLTCQGASSDTSCVITGLTDGTPYTFDVIATNASSLDSGPSTETVAFIPGGSRFTPIAPVRALDTRSGVGQGGTGARVGDPAQGGSNTAGSAVSLAIRGVTIGAPGNTAVIPNDVTAVVMNVTASGLSSPAGSPQFSYLSVWPGDGAVPTASNLNFAVGQSVPNLVTVGVGTDGAVRFFNKRGAVNVIADVVGYYRPDNGDLLTAVSPVRALDTRSTAKVGDPAQGSSNTDGSAVSLALRGQTINGVTIPNDATAVVMNVTASGLVSPAGSPQFSYVTVWPGDTATAPTASNLNFSVGQTVPNLVTVGIGTDGAVKFFNKRGAVNVIADVVGYYSPSAAGDRFFPIAPRRSLDTRDGTGGDLAKVGGVSNSAGQYINLTIAGRTTVPATGVDSVIMNVTATGFVAPTGGPSASYLTIWPRGTSTPPTASNLNFGLGQSVPNLVLCKLGASGGVSIFNKRGGVDVVADVVGFYAGAVVVP